MQTPHRKSLRPLSSCLSSTSATNPSVSKSISNSSLRPGRCTLTTTWAPLCSTARCTWPRDAAAMGLRSNRANIWSTGRPRSASITATALSAENAGTRSCRRESAKEAAQWETHLQLGQFRHKFCGEQVRARRKQPARVLVCLCHEPTQQLPKDSAAPYATFLRSSTVHVLAKLDKQRS